MGQESGSGFCRVCNAQVMTARNAPSHLAHFILAVLTVGFWIPIWFLITLAADSPRCSRCGGGVSGGHVNGAASLALIGIVIVGGSFAYFKFFAAEKPKEPDVVAASADQPPIATGEEANIAADTSGRGWWWRSKPAASSTAASAALPLASPTATQPALPIAITTEPVEAKPMTAAFQAQDPTPAAPAKPWQASRKWTVSGKLVEGSIKTWSPTKVVIVTAGGIEVVTTRDALSDLDRYWVDSKLR